MITLFEHFAGYLDVEYELPREFMGRVIKGETPCFSLRYDEAAKRHRFKTSFFVGVDWIVENERSVYVQPKQNKEGAEIDYIATLLEALREPDNFDHLDGLCEIDFHEPYITIDQSQDKLSPFLIAQFLQLLRSIVRKGLKKSYYSVSENLNARVKGKIMIGRDIAINKTRGRFTNTACRFHEFGVDCDENRILKRACSFARRAVQSFIGVDAVALRHILDYVSPAFENVSENIAVDRIESFRPNPLFGEYNLALKLARLILRRYSYNISMAGRDEIPTPPFWIDMSKLFELYVYRKLREAFGREQVIYHLRVVQNQELDFLIKGEGDCKYVVDAKYKPRYKNRMIGVDDIRQVAGYARAERVYRELGVSDSEKSIKCLIIYSCRDGVESLAPWADCIIEKERGYRDIFKIGVRLPEAKNR